MVGNEPKTAELNSDKIFQKILEGDLYVKYRERGIYVRPTLIPTFEVFNLLNLFLRRFSSRKNTWYSFEDNLNVKSKRQE